MCKGKRKRRVLPKYEDGKANVFRRSDGSYFYSDGTKETPILPFNTTLEDPRYWTYIDADGKLYTPNQTPLNNTVVKQDNDLYTRLQIENARNQRSWLSDAADYMHAIGEGAMIASNFAAPEIEPLLYPAFNSAKSYITNMANKYLASDASRILSNSETFNLFIPSYSNLLNQQLSLPYKNFAKLKPLIEESVEGEVPIEKLISPLSKEDIDILRKTDLDKIIEDEDLFFKFIYHFKTTPYSWKEKTLKDIKYFLKDITDAELYKALYDLYNHELNGALKIWDDVVRIKNNITDNDSKTVTETKDKIINLLKSKQYRQRLLDDGFSELIADKFILEQLQKILNVPIFIQNKKLINPKRLLEEGRISEILNAKGVYFPESNSILVVDDYIKDLKETIGHELIHASDNGLGVSRSNKYYKKLLPKAEKGFWKHYYSLPTEQRTRILEPLADALDRGYDINDYNQLQEYLLFNKAHGNHNVKSVFDNYDISIPNLLDVYRKAFQIGAPVGSGIYLYNKFNE